MSTDDLEQRVRAGLNRQADTVPIPVDAWAAFCERLAEPDVPASPNTTGRRPTAPAHQRSWRRPAAAAAAIAAVAAGGVAASSILLPNPAYASWDDRPDPISAAESRAASTECGVAAPLAIDRRGNHAYVFGVERSAVTSCVVTLPGHDAEGLVETYVGHRSTANEEPSPTRPLTVIDAKAPEGNHVDSEPAPLEYVAGRVSPRITRVVIHTSRGRVTATLHDGVYAAWWPGNDADRASVHAYDSAGHEVASATRLDHSAATVMTH